MSETSSCSIKDCGRPVHARGWCSTHYQRWLKHSDVSDEHARGNVTDAKRRTALESRIKVDALGCWIWTGRRASPTGYGTLRAGRKRKQPEYAHRVSYTVYKGPIPDGYQIDHLCRVVACVNPEHLEAVPPRINVLRGQSPSAVSARTGRCLKGHEFTPENTIHYGGKRRCRTCNRAWRRENWAKIKAIGAQRASSAP